MKTPHTATRKGTKVRVQLKTGEVFIDKFLDRTRGKICVFEQRGRVPVADIKAFGNLRQQQVSHWKRY